MILNTLRVLYWQLRIIIAMYRVTRKPSDITRAKHEYVSKRFNAALGPTKILNYKQLTEEQTRRAHILQEQMQAFGTN